MLFQVTLLAYSYTFVSKRTVWAFIKNLEHEAAVYKHLKPIQGLRAPVFLGIIHVQAINKIYSYDHQIWLAAPEAIG